MWSRLRAATMQTRCEVDDGGLIGGAARSRGEGDRVQN